MLKKYKKCIVLLILGGIIFACFGCNTFITIYEENTQANDLPQLHPDDGIRQIVTGTLYYKLLNTNYLVPVQREIVLTVNEPLYEALLRYLSRNMDEPSAYASAFPPNVRIIEVSQSGNIIYVTLNQEFLRAENYASGKYSKMLVVYSIVNTITKYKEQVSVQILVDENGDGVGERISYSALSLSPSLSLVEPLVYNSEVVADAGRILEQAFNSLAMQFFDRALPLFTATEMKIDENNLRVLFGLEYKLKMFSVKKVITSADSSVAYVEIDAEFQYYSTGEAKSIVIDGANVPMYMADGIYKISFEDLLRIIEEAPR